MPYLNRNEANNSPALYYQDCGSGKPVILIHGWPLSHTSWEAQVPALVAGGFRVIAYDRRGFGKSEPVWDQYSYDVLAEDLKTLIEELQLSDVSLVGFSMGGGEVVRYLSRYGSGNIARAVLIASIIPLVPQKEDNPDGVPQEDLDKITEALKTDRVGFLKQFHKNFYNYGML
ncbi:MAG: alpha/beta hydrolase, partial [Chitinophagaceae bacterium]|nr:alpha/beta hydrolase [Chitinophagaceae bacterium]